MKELALRRLGYVDDDDGMFAQREGGRFSGVRCAKGWGRVGGVAESGVYGVLMQGWGCFPVEWIGRI